MNKTFLFGKSVYAGAGEYATCNEQDFIRMQNDDSIYQQCEKAAILAADPSKAEELSKIKKQLPVLVVGAKELTGDGRRCNENVVPSGRYVFNLDHLDNEKNIHRFTPEEIFGTFIEEKEWINKIFWVFISPSGTGLKWAYDLLPGETIEKSQERMAQLLPEELRQAPFYDKHTDPSRCTFMVPEENNLYINPYVMFGEVDEDLDNEDEDLDNEDFEEIVVRYEDTPKEIKSEPETTPVQPTYPETYNYLGTPISFKSIIDNFWAKNGGEPQWNIPNGRNSAIFELVRFLAPLFENNIDWIHSVVPNYGLKEEEFQEVISQALKYSYPGLTKELKQQLYELKNKIAGQSTPDSEEENTPEWERILWELDEKGWPMGLKECLTETSDFDKMPTICSVLTAMTAFLDGMEFISSNGRKERVVLQTVVVGRKGGGKSVCTRAARRYWNILREEEKEAWEKIANWQNSETEARPKDIIRAIPADFTQAGIRNAALNAHGATMLIVEDEADTLIKTPSYETILFTLRKAFGGEEDGALRASKKGYSGIENSYISFVMNATPDQGQALLGGNNLTNGTTDRMLPCLFPKVWLKGIPFYKQPTDEDLQNIRLTAEKLRKVKGVIEIPRINAEANRWVIPYQEKAEKENNDELYEMLGRIIAIATRATIPYLILTGGEETDDVVMFMRMMLEYTLQMKYNVLKGWFGEQKRAQMPPNIPIEHKTKKLSQDEILQKLPSPFGHADIAEYYSGSATARDKMISRWKADKKIDKVASGRWIKL